MSFTFVRIQIFMSRQYPNRPFVPPRRRVSLQMCEFISYSPAEPNDTPTNSTPWSLADPLSYMHSSSTLVPPVAVAATATASANTLTSPSIPATNDFSYFQYPSHRHPVSGSSISGPNRELPNNTHLSSFNESNPSCHFHYMGSNDLEQNRPSAPFTRITVRFSCHCRIIILIDRFSFRLLHQQLLQRHIIDTIVWKVHQLPRLFDIHLGLMTSETLLTVQDLGHRVRTMPIIIQNDKDPQLSIHQRHNLHNHIILLLIIMLIITSENVQDKRQRISIRMNCTVLLLRMFFHHLMYHSIMYLVIHIFIHIRTYINS